MNVNLQTKYLELQIELVNYLQSKQMKTQDTWDAKAKTLYAKIESFKVFCKMFFNININENLC